MGLVKLLLDGLLGALLATWFCGELLQFIESLFIDPIETIQGFELCLHANPVSRFCSTSLLITYIVA